MKLALVIVFLIISFVGLVVVALNAKNLYKHSCEGKLGIPAALLFLLSELALIIGGAVTLLAYTNTL